MDIIQITAISLIILIGSFIAIGIWFKRKVTSAEDFLLAGRSAPFWLLGAAYIGGMIGGASVAGYTGYGYSMGISSMWTSLFMISGMTAFVAIFARRLNHFGRKTGAVTIGDFICTRFGESMRLPVALVSCTRPLFLTGMQFLAIAIAINVVFDLPIQYGVPLAALGITLYMIGSGQYATMVTQWIQSTLQSISILLFSLAAFKFLGSPSEASASFYSQLPEAFVDFWNVDPKLFSVWLLTMGVFYLVDPWVYMWAYIGRSPRVSSNAQLAVLGSSYFNVLPFLAGMTVAVMVGAGTLALPESLSGDAIYVWFASNHLSVVLGSVIMVGLFMTIISCGSSFAMNGVTILTRDIYQKRINPNATNEQGIRASRICVLIVVAVGVASALWLPILVPLWVLAQAIALSGLLAPVLSAWFWPRATRSGAMASCIGGGGAALAWSMFAWLNVGTPGGMPYGIHAVHIGLLVSIPLMILVSLATKNDAIEQPEATSYKKLGEDMHQSPLVEDLPTGPGIFGWLGAKTPSQKFWWATVFIIFILHYLLSFAFSIEIVGLATMWISIITGAVMIVLFLIMGGKDIVQLIKETNAETEQKVSEQKLSMKVSANEGI